MTSKILARNDDLAFLLNFPKELAMGQMTITEALSEINLIKKKIEKKKEVILANLAKAEHMPDPYEKEGGGLAFNKAELQSIQDLYLRLIKIRGAISKANNTHEITIQGKIRTIGDWLTWRREIAEEAKKFLIKLCQGTKANMEVWSKQPQVYKDDQGNTHLVKYTSNIDYSEIMKNSEELGDIFEKLDGQLSLKNATIMIDI